MTAPAEGPAGIRSVFVSYSRSDKPRVDGLADLLRGLGLSVFLDQRSIVAGDRWRDALERALSSCDAIVVVWSRQAAKSEWVRREYQTAASRRIRVIPVPIDATPLSELLAEHQTANLLPLMNELLQIQRQLREVGAAPAEVRARIRERLRQEGIDVDERRLNAILVFTGGLGVGFVPALLARTAARLTEGGMTVSGWGAAFTLSAVVAAGLLAQQTLSNKGRFQRLLAAQEEITQGLQKQVGDQSLQLRDALDERDKARGEAARGQEALEQSQDDLSQCRSEERRPRPPRRAAPKPAINECRRDGDCNGGKCIDRACVDPAPPPPPPPPPPKAGDKPAPTSTPNGPFIFKGARSRTFEQKPPDPTVDFGNVATPADTKPVVR